MTSAQGLYIVAGAAALLVFLSVMVLALTWLERKALARIQMRMGPMRVGFHGALQPIADAMKLVSKEDILPSWADRRIYWLAPLAVFVPAFLLWVTIPVARDVALANLDLGLFYIVAISVLSVMGLVMAGWSSANKYAMLGGLRAAGQLVSYRSEGCCPADAWVVRPESRPTSSSTCHPNPRFTARSSGSGSKRVTSS